MAMAFAACCSSFPCHAILSRLPCRPSSVSRRISSHTTKAAIAKPELEVLYDDGFGGVGTQDYLQATASIAKPDGGPPRWFCPVECGRPIDRAPLLIFLPGLDGIGMGLIMHHKPLGKVFEVRCLHIPVYDRTPFEGLLQFVQKSLKEEHAISPSRPIYIVGDSLGGCLALSVAACNPTIDLVLILVNPATSFEKSSLQPLLALEALPRNFDAVVPYLLSFAVGGPVKTAMASFLINLSPPVILDKLSSNMCSLLPLFSELSDIVPLETLLWKLKLFKSAASYANSRLHAVEAEVLLLASGKDNLLPSGEESDRLWSTLKNCRVRYFKESGHTLLLENEINLLTIVKGTCMYRRSREHDFVTDYLPPSLSEYNKTFGQDYRLFHDILSPAVFSTLESGKIVRGLSGLPDRAPLLLVGNHMMLGFEMTPLAEALWKERKLLLHGMAHPVLFSGMLEFQRQELTTYDVLLRAGATPVTAGNMYRLLHTNAAVLLYPGGAREALHRKGEEYKLFWPDRPEFVRMAAKCGATIIPFGVVGEDDLIELVLDYNEQKRIPFLREWIEDLNRSSTKPRATDAGEEGNQDMYVPGILPKIPGRFYYLFGRPMHLDRAEVLRDKQHAMSVYLNVKSRVEDLISYLRRKREEDPYRSIAQRSIYRAFWGPSAEMPTFEL